MDGNNSSFIKLEDKKSEYSHDIQRCLLLNGFKQQNRRWIKKLNTFPERFIYFTESGAVAITGSNSMQRVVSLINFTTIEDWNWAVSHIDELTYLNVVKPNV